MGERFSEATFDHSLTELEGGVRDHWEREDIFRRSIEERPADNTFTFNDGPPFATGLPHYGHILPGAIKDAIPRYQTMQGHRVPRTWGWDCHGLPIEALVQEELGLDGRQAILDHGIGEFSDACRAAVLRHVDEWKHTQALLGRWVDMEDPYMTMDVEYIESVWWVFEQLYEKGLIYEGQKVVAYSPGLSSPLSNFEAGLNYKDIEDTAVTIAFELEGEPDTKLLAWTTT
ncbi:MAG: class I tRNA ligase family protein, partial [Candidatus Peregrinibacteria bacterium]|nr:class I tRNA ligase family protein [Candidatus Peregrinibacteria bacterium]